MTIGSGCTFYGANRLASGTNIRKLSFGYASYCGEETYVHNALIGKYTCIGPRTRTIDGKHPTKDFVSIHPAFYSTRKQAGFTYVNNNKFEELPHPKYDGYSIKIGNDVWIGADVRILDGVEIGDGAIVATGAVVSNDIPSYAIVGGVPAKIIRYRFSEDDIKFLQQLQWWDKDEKWIKAHVDQFGDIKILIQEVKKDGE
ncbi:MAG TPA: CatB-related O-acetyltransferase [Clostridium sp.]|uniref:CatB-related O-acetyltransferase n=1 Tax=Clostridium sp. TaxID=1506 RepID=UPI002F93816B